MTQWPTDPEAWVRLGRHLRAARGGRTRKEIEAEAGVSATMVQRYERGKVHAEPPDKMWQLVNFYRWTPDSVLQVLEGGLPEHFPPLAGPMDPVRRVKVTAAIRGDSTLSADEQRDLLRILFDER